MVAVLGSDANATTVELVSAWRDLGLDAELLSARQLARARLRPSDVVLGRLDVLPTLDGVEPGLYQLLLLERRGGGEVLNPARVLLAAHDKLRTARVLEMWHMPHPRTAHVRSVAVPPFDGPYVVKPRFGSWGTDVSFCEDAPTLRARLAEVRDRPWFRRHGALVQEAVPNGGRDLRVVVAGGRVVGAAERIAGAGEWRTNVSCGGELRPVELDDDAGELALATAALVGADLVGVDLMPADDGRYVVLELNGAVEFENACALGGVSVAEAAASTLGLTLPVG